MHNSARMNVAIAVVRKAASEILRFNRHRGGLKISEKAPGDLVTNADLTAEAVILNGILEKYPNDGYISEERGIAGNQDSCWILDPIDGTTNFVHGLPEYAISLAYCEKQQPKIGVIYDISRDDLYTAEVGKGAYCNQRKMRVAPTKLLKDAVISSTGGSGVNTWRWEFLANATKRSSGFRRLGSSTIELALTAKGAIDCCFGKGLHAWDYVAGAIMIQETGGVFYPNVDTTNKLDFAQRLDFSIFGTPLVAKQVLQLVKPQLEKENGTA